MLDSLQLVRGAVSKERLVPVLSHFAFRDGRVCGFDGRTYINAPAPDITLNLTVPCGVRRDERDGGRGGEDQTDAAR
jgi:hypothetical protein